MKLRLQTLLSSEKITSSKFADIIGVNRSSISHILSGRNNPSLDILQKVLTKFPHINPDWLLLGQGSMFRNKSDESLLHKAPTSNLLFNTETQGSNNELEPDIKAEDPLLIDEPDIIEDKEEKPDNIVLNKSNINNETKNVASRKLEKIVFFYSDKTFDIYNPDNIQM